MRSAPLAQGVSGRGTCERRILLALRLGAHLLADSHLLFLEHLRLVEIGRVRRLVEPDHFLVWRAQGRMELFGSLSWRCVVVPAQEEEEWDG